MPITRKQFDLGITEQIEDWMRTVHEYLADHEDAAFSIDDLDEYFEVDGIAGTDWQNLRIALMKLAEVGAAAKRRIGGAEYYRYRAKLTDI